MKLYYATDPMKIMNLRMDTLAQMLNMANVRAGANYMVSSGTNCPKTFLKPKLCFGADHIILEI
jgi:hypothetical protein